MGDSNLNVTNSYEEFDIHQANEFLEEVKRKVKNGDSLTQCEIEEISIIYSRVYFEIITPIADIVDDILSEVIDIVTAVMDHPAAKEAFQNNHV